MLQFQGKFTRNGEIVAWRISDDGVEYNIAYRAIYHEFYFKPMIEAGYKFHDYHGGVTTPDGFNLRDVIESNEYLSDSELIDLIDTIETGMMDEKDIVQYFDRDVKVEYVDVRQPENPTLTTREQFVGYLDTLIAAKDHNIHKFSYQSVNSFTKREALFTLEEVVANKDDARVRFVKMFENHVMTSLNDLSKLQNEYGIKGMGENESMMAILKGFFEYGVPGINANIVKISFEMNPDASYANLKQSTASHALLKYGIRRNADYKFFSEDVNGRDFGSMAGDDNFDSNAFIGASSITSISPEPISSQYTIVPYGDKKAPPRIIIDMISEDGIRATFMADCNEAHMYRGMDEMFSTLRMFSYKTMDNVYIPFSRIASNGVQYIADSVLIRSYIAEQIKKSTVAPKYENTFKLMVGIGVSPYYAPMYINNLLRQGAEQYVDIANISEFTKLHYACSETFRDGFSQNIISKYGTGEDDFTEKPLMEQLEFINEEVSNLESQGKYLVKPEIPDGTLRLASPEYNEWFDEYMANEIGNVNFVTALLNGEQNIGKMAIGMNLDSNQNNYKAFNVIYGAFMAAKGEDPGINLNEFLSGVIDNYIDNEIMFKERKMTALGCAKDMVLFRSDMATTSHSLVYVTKVFRENGNADATSANRHYGFECIVFEKGPGSKGSTIFNAIYEQIVDDLQRKGFTDNMFIAADATATIIMGVLTAKDRIESVEGVCYLPFSTTLSNGQKYEVKVKLGASYYEPIRNGSMFTKKYSSNYDFSENQFSKANMKCDFYCVNAAINPWAVIPREGYKIPEYNLFINYFKKEELARVYPASVIEKIDSTNAKVVDCLRETFTSNELFPKMPSIFTKAEEMAHAQNGFFLSRSEDEDIESYINRTISDIRTAKENGKAVKNTVLKSDVQYDMFKPYVYVDGVDCDTTFYEEFSGPITNRHVTNMAPRILSHTWQEELLTSDAAALTSGTRDVAIERIKFAEIPYELKEWNQNLLMGAFDANANVYISRGRVNYMNDKFKVLSDMTERDFEELCELKVAIQINSNNYIIKTINGLVKVGV